jgi:hypothetical protein
MPADLKARSGPRIRLFNRIRRRALEEGDLRSSDFLPCAGQQRRAQQRRR